jgi:L-aminopeptidase/D-esterase-like protein
MSTTIRARDIGIPFNGIPGAFNSITDVHGVEVGHKTIIEDIKKSSTEKISARTGVTVILPRGKHISGDLGEQQSFGAWYSLNGNGEMTGTTWLEESGLLGPVIAITNTHSVGTVRDALVQWLIQQSESILPDDDYFPVRSLPVVAETWDGFLSDINGFHVHREHVFDAIESAKSGYVDEGNVGGGTGMMTHEFKGGIGTSSRKCGKYTVGVLVQSNYGRRHLLTIAGTPVGQEMINELLPVYGKSLTKKKKSEGEGSIIVVVATDAPLLPHQLKRLARRVPLGIGIVGGRGENNSGDIFIAFSTANHQDIGETRDLMDLKMLPNDKMNPLFDAVTQATEEAILNAMIAAKTMEGNHGNKAYAIPHDRIREILKVYNKLQGN